MLKLYLSGSQQKVCCPLRVCVYVFYIKSLLRELPDEMHLGQRQDEVDILCLLAHFRSMFPNVSSKFSNF